MDPHHLCHECAGTGWVSYYSETLEGEFEEAYCLCPNRCTPRRCMAFKAESPCPHPRIVRYGLGYYCKEYAELIVASRSVEYACEAIYYLRH